MKEDIHQKVEKDIFAILKKYPDKVPVLVKKDPRSNIDQIDKEKFLVPKELSFAQFIYVIRKRLKLSPEKAIFVFFGNQLVCSTYTMEQVYELYKDKKTGMLHATYAAENTFG